MLMRESMKRQAEVNKIFFNFIFEPHTVHLIRAKEW